MKDDTTSIRVHQSVEIGKLLKPEHVPFWVEPRLISRQFSLSRIFYEDSIRGTLLLARRDQSDAYPSDGADSPALDPSRCTGVWFRPTKKIAQQLKAVEMDMVDVFERIRTKTAVAGDMSLAGYLRQLWDHFLFTLASPTRTFGTFDKPFPLLSISEPHMQNALANRALGRSYKIGALFCLGKLMHEPASASRSSQASTKVDGVVKRPARKGRAGLRVISSDEEENLEPRNDPDSSGDGGSQGNSSESEQPAPKRVRVLLWDEKGELTASLEAPNGGRKDNGDARGSPGKISERRAALKKRSGWSTATGEASQLAVIRYPQPQEEDDAARREGLRGLAAIRTHAGGFLRSEKRSLSSKVMAEAMQIDEEDVDGVELAGTDAEDEVPSAQRGLRLGLKSRYRNIDHLFEGCDASEEEFFGSTTPADDDLSDWMPDWT